MRNSTVPARVSSRPLLTCIPCVENRSDGDNGSVRVYFAILMEGERLYLAKQQKSSARIVLSLGSFAVKIDSKAGFDSLLRGQIGEIKITQRAGTQP